MQQTDEAQSAWLHAQSTPCLSNEIFKDFHIQLLQKMHIPKCYQLIVWIHSPRPPELAWTSSSAGLCAGAASDAYMRTHGGKWVAISRVAMFSSSLTHPKSLFLWASSSCLLSSSYNNNNIAINNNNNNMEFSYSSVQLHLLSEESRLLFLQSCCL